MSFLSILMVLENCNFRSLKVLEKSLNFVLSVCYEPCIGTGMIAPLVPRINACGSCSCEITALLI